MNINKVIEIMIEEQMNFLRGFESNRPVLPPEMEAVLSYHRGRLSGLNSARELINTNPNLNTNTNIILKPKGHEGCLDAGNECRDCEYLVKCLIEEREEEDK